MTVYCLGSINIDHVYRLPALPQAGETTQAVSHQPGLGGKGVNQSVAALRAGARVVHVGAVGQGDAWIEGELTRHGIALDHIARVGQGTGHAIVAVDDAGENQIIIYPGANRAQDPARIATALAGAAPGDILLVQNETSHQVQAAQMARAAGMRVFYSAAPFVLEPLLAVLPHVTHLLVNAGEAAALVQATGQALTDLPVQAVIVTRGAQGAEWIAPGAGPRGTPPVAGAPVGNTRPGALVCGSGGAALGPGETPAEALRHAAAAAALQVTRPGAAPAMPWLTEVQALLAR